MWSSDRNPDAKNGPSLINGGRILQGDAVRMDETIAAFTVPGERLNQIWPIILEGVSLT